MKIIKRKAISIEGLMKLKREEKSQSILDTKLRGITSI